MVDFLSVVYDITLVLSLPLFIITMISGKLKEITFISHAIKLMMCISLYWLGYKSGAVLFFNGLALLLVNSFFDDEE